MIHWLYPYKQINVDVNVSIVLVHNWLSWHDMNTKNVNLSRKAVIPYSFPPMIILTLSIKH